MGIASYASACGAAGAPPMSDKFRFSVWVGLAPTPHAARINVAIMLKLNNNIFFMIFSPSTFWQLLYPKDEQT
jgi:hypothetical protein